MSGKTRVRFSLVELMVVMAVISVLAGLLLPVLRQACATARTAACGSNLRQIGLAAVKYAAEQDDWVISAYAHNRVGSWINYFCRELCGGSREVFRCPALPLRACFSPPGGKGAYQISLRASYLMNACNSGTGVDAWAGSTISAKERSWGWTRGFSGHAKYALPVRLGWVRRSGDKIMAVDASALFADLAPLARSGAGRYIDRYRQTDHGPPLASPAYASYRNVGSHHRGGFNALLGGAAVMTRRVSEDRAWAACLR